MIYQRCAAPVRTRAAQGKRLRQAARRYYDLDQQKVNLLPHCAAAADGTREPLPCAGVNFYAYGDTMEVCYRITVNGPLREGLYLSSSAFQSTIQQG